MPFRVGVNFQSFMLYMILFVHSVAKGEFTKSKIKIFLSYFVFKTILIFFEHQHITTHHERETFPNCNIRDTNGILSNFKTLSKTEHQSADCGFYDYSGVYYHLSDIS